MKVSPSLRLRLSCAIVAFSVLNPTTSFGAEIDNFTHRYDDIEDATPYVNEIVNELFQTAIRKTNRWTWTCNKSILLRVLNYTTGGFLWAALENSIEEHPDIDRRFTPMDESVYRDLRFWDMPPVHIAKLGEIIRMGDHIVGTDKIGHLIDTGFNYYEIAYIDGEGEEAAFKYGDDTELGYYGLATTGVMSYADLVANYEGMLFWGHVLGDKIPTDNPFIVCKDNNWVLNREIDLSEYINAGMDEAINCNEYWDVAFAASIQDNLDELEADNPGSRYSCPAVPSRCADLIDQYGTDELGQRLLHPVCIAEGKNATAQQEPIEPPEPTNWTLGAILKKILGWFNW